MGGTGATKEMMGANDKNMKVKVMWRVWVVMLTWGAIAVGPVRGMAPLTNDYRKEAVQQLYANYKKCFPEIPDISPAEAMKMGREGRTVFVDVRSPSEMSVSRLPGAISMTEFLNDKDRYRGKTIIAYDTIGYRSGLEVQKLRETGLGVVNLQGGILGWMQDGGKVYDDNGETKRVHVYGALWNYAPGGCETVR